jgi:hypothetical protein
VPVAGKHGQSSAPDVPGMPGRSEADPDAEGTAVTAPEPRPDETLVKALVRAHRWRRRIESGQAKSITDLAEQEGVTDAYACRLLPLTCLAPDLVEAILDGRQPKGLRLAEVLGNGPLARDEHRMSWGTRFADGEVVTGLRTEDRGPVANDPLERS